MTRIRTIKPEFWSDEKLAVLCPIDRLVFLGLISLSDDYGRVHDNVKVIDAFVFPETSHSVRESLANLSRIGRIVRGSSSSGMRILEIVNWARHQRVDKPQPHKALPPIKDFIVDDPKKHNENKGTESFANNSGIVLESVANNSVLLPPTTDLGSGTTDHRSPITDLGPEDSFAIALQPTKPPTVLTFECSGKVKFWDLTGDQVCEWQELYPSIDVIAECKKAKAWTGANPKKTASGMLKFLVHWLNKATNSSGGNGSAHRPVTFAEQRLINSKQAIEDFINGR